MNKKIALTMGLVLLGLCLFQWAVAGSLDPTAGPSDSGSAMYTLEDIYNRLTGNTEATKRSGAFTEPSAAPAATGHTLDEIYELAIPTQVPKTGQTSSTVTGDDGNLQKGVAWPSTRFTDNGDGTVTDNMTGLVWLQDADCRGDITDWTTAVSDAVALYDGCTNCFGTSGDCGLSDSSVAGDWRLPNIRELLSLIDYGRAIPALPSGHPFSNVNSPLYYVTFVSSGSFTGDDGAGYWTSTGRGSSSNHKWGVNLYYGQPVLRDITSDSNYYVWPVRDK